MKYGCNKWKVNEAGKRKTCCNTFKLLPGTKNEGLIHVNVYSYLKIIWENVKQIRNVQFLYLCLACSWKCSRTVSLNGNKNLKNEGDNKSYFLMKKCTKRLLEICWCLMALSKGFALNMLKKSTVLLILKIVTFRKL